MPITLYGIKNCDSVKKATKWLDRHDITYHFHDFRAQGINAEQIRAWLAQPDFINKRSTTWKQLSDKQRDALSSGDETQTIKTVSENPTLIKRPALSTGASVHFGFSEKLYTSLLLGQ